MMELTNPVYLMEALELRESSCSDTSQGFSAYEVD